jgi:hypothetical protein
VEAASQREEARLAAVVLEGCAKILANAELARIIGTRACTAVISQSAKDNPADLHRSLEPRAI